MVGSYGPFSIGAKGEPMKRSAEALYVVAIHITPILLLLYGCTTTFDKNSDVDTGITDTLDDGIGDTTIDSSTPDVPDADAVDTNGEPPCWYHDYDGDGYGNPEEIICDFVSPPHYVATPGDCCDLDVDSHPDAMWHNDGANECGSWDWNCDMVIEVNRPGMTTCSDLFDETTCLAAEPGWNGDVESFVPSCGATGDYLGYGCVWEVGHCFYTTHSEWVQHCR
jgi:hypothetical protein